MTHMTREDVIDALLQKGFLEKHGGAIVNGLALLGKTRDGFIVYARDDDPARGETTRQALLAMFAGVENVRVAPKVIRPAVFL